MDLLKRFIRGTIFLMIVIFSTKLLGFLFRMYFMRHAGEEAVGYYMSAYPAFIFFISVVQLGLPIAIAKLVAEHSARKEHMKVNALMQKSMFISFISCAFFIPILLLISPFIATTLLNQNDLTTLLQISIIAIPFVVFSSIFKSYLQGLLHISPTALAQLLEQGVRIALVALALPLYSNAKNAIELATIVMLFTVIAELFAFCILYVLYKKNKPTNKRAPNYPSKPILQTAIPAQGSKLFGTFTWFLEPIVFMKALATSGISAITATAIYGIVAGVYIPLLLFPAFIPAALSIVLIPAISEVLAKSNIPSVQRRVSLAMRLCSLIGCISCIYFYLYGDQMAALFFHLNETHHYMLILAPVFYFYYIQSPMHAILQAVGEAKTAMMNSIYGGIAKLFVMLMLASQPIFQENGAIIAIGFGVLITSFLHIHSLKQQSILRISIRPFFNHYALFIFIVLLNQFSPFHLPFQTEIVVNSILLLALLIFTKQLQIDDFKKVKTLFSRL